MRQITEALQAIADRTAFTDEAEREKVNGLIAGADEAIREEYGEEEEEKGDGLDNELVADLHKIAEKEDVPDHKELRKPELVAAIRKHREAAAA